MFFFSTEVKKKNPEFLKISEVAHPCYYTVLYIYIYIIKKGQHHTIVLLMPRPQPTCAKWSHRTGPAVF